MRDRQADGLPHRAAVCLWTLVLLGGGSLSADAQTVPPGATPAFTDISLDTQNPDLTSLSRGIVGSGYSASSAIPSGPSKPFREVLRGNGTGVGYVLSHGGILPDSVSIHVGVNKLRPGTDYWLDPVNGTLTFAQSIHTFDSVEVYYRFVEGQDAGRQPMSLPGLQFGLGASTKLNLFYGMTSGNGSGLNSSLYGLGLNGKFGGNGFGSYRSLLFFSNTQQSNNVVTLSPYRTNAAQSANQPQAGLDNLILQNLAAKTGGFNFRADYQDVGKNFTGFQSLRLNNANDKAMLDELTQLEKEKGVRRLGLGFGYSPTTKGATAQGLQLDWNQIQDEKGSISQQTLGYTSSNFHVNYTDLSIGTDFAHFAGLREADRDLWGRQKGMQISNLGFGFNFGPGKAGASRGGMDFMQQSFGDTTGNLRRSVWSLQSGSLGFTMLNRKATKSFGRLNDLADADKTNLALDLYKEYDPQAKVEQVTANDRTETGREAGLSRDALRVDLGLGKKGSLALSQLGAQDEGSADAGFRREEAALHLGGLQLEFLSRKTDAGFTRLADLADVEKNYLALDIRRQFDPNTTLAQVTQKDRDQILKEAGLARTALRGSLALGKGGKDGLLSFSQFAIADQPASAPGSASTSVLGAIRRMAFEYTNKNLRFLLSEQAIDDAFARLGDLSDVERAQFGNEHGLKHDHLALDWQINKTTKVSFDSVSVAATADAVAGAAAAAKQAGTDPQAAARTAANGFQRENLQLVSQGFKLAFDHADTDQNFARASDLALPAADQQAISNERGFARTDYSLHYDHIKGLTLDSYIYGALNPLESLEHNIYKQNFLYAPNKRLSLSIVRDGDMASSDGKSDGLLHTQYALDQNFGKGVLLKLYSDQATTYTKGDVTQDARTDFLHFETDKSKPNNFSFENKQVTYMADKYEDTVNLNVHVKPTSRLSFSYSKLDIDRGTDPSADTDSFDFQWQTTKQFAVVGGVAQTTTNNKTDADTVSVGLQGQPTKEVTLTAKFDESHQNAVNTKDTADISLCNSKPISLGPLKDLTITARYASLNDQRKLQNETMTGRASWTLWKNQFLLDYNGLTNVGGITSTTRTYSFISDPNPNKRFHAVFLYKQRTMLDGTDRLTRRFGVDWRIAKATSFTYTYGTLPEDDKGNLTPLTTANVEFKHAFRPDLETSLFYRLSDNQATKIMTRSLGLSLTGKLNKKDKLEFAYSREADGFPDHYIHGDHLHLLFDHQVSTDHYLTLSADVRPNDSQNLVGEIQGNLDFHLLF